MNNLRFDQIPAELRARDHWVAAGPDKLPINPRTGDPADPANPSTGASFAEAVQTGLKHIGLILAADDNLIIIDLDDPYTRSDKSRINVGDDDYPAAVERARKHTFIFNSFNTYTERSASGRGAHIVMRGSIPCSVRRDKVEIYGKERYMIFTGDVIRQVGVNDCQSQIDEIFSGFGKMITPQGELIEEEPVLDDGAVWAMACRASNAEKFRALCASTADTRPGRKDGSWTQLPYNYESQSEADLALLSMLAFYSRSNEQVRRMFRQTHLAQRSKALRNDKYINRTLRGIRSKQPPLVDVSHLTPIVREPAAAQTPAPEPDEVPAIPVPPTEGYTFPPGLIGEMASYFLSSAYRPFPEMALVAAITLAAGICGRSYNISNTGLNQYVILLAQTGRGKEGAATAIEMLLNAVKQKAPLVEQFMGPAAFSSGQALVKTVSKGGKSCFVSVLGEFGLMLQQMCDVKAPAHLVQLRRVLLDLYSKSGHSKILRPSAYSDSERDTALVQSPNVTILGESTPETFFSGLDHTHIADGLIPRFMVVEYRGLRPPPNPNAFHLPPPQLVDRFADLVTIAVNTGSNNSCCPVGVHPEAKRLLDAFNREMDRRINSATLTMEAEIWNRAHLKALKLSALVAVGVSPHSPNVSLEIAQWAADFVRREGDGMMSRFKSGDVGDTETKQELEIKRLFTHFQTLSGEQRLGHRCPEALLDTEVCPLNYITTYGRRLACFKNDRRGAAKAISETLNDMVRHEVLEMIPLQQLQNQYGMKAAIYYAGPGWK